LDGIGVYRLRCIDLLERSGAPDSLKDALRHVPDESPRSVYEALVAWNFLYYIDGCDDPGGLDRGLLPYWKGEDIRPLLKELYRHVDDNNGWSMPLGPGYSSLTVQCIDAARNCRRPSIQLLVTEDMPGEVWDATCASLATGCGQPALYNWPAYKREINARLPEVSEADLRYLAFGGCTETMIEGVSNVGSDDAGINAALIFDGFLREKLGSIPTFEEFMERYVEEAEKAIRETCAILEEYRRTRAEFRPQPVRTLFVDDCIDRMTDFNAGGARYYWSVINVAGLINVVDSMQVVKTLIYDEKRYEAGEFLEKLDARDPAFLAECAALPKHGNGDASVDAIARAISGRIWAEFERHSCTPRGKYFPVSNQFTTYEGAGFGIRATPDGRGYGEPLCDSCGAIRGRDKNGPTALLSSVAALRLDLVLGTPVTNIRISKNSLPDVLRPLVEGFFRMGGMQLQVTCASREELLDALAHPEKHENLVVRIGGFSEYFNRLSPVLKQTVIDRTEY
jgi:formate C-acetyltransferase